MISRLDWAPEYSVGHKGMDDQHRGLLAICKSMQQALESDSPDSNEVVHRTLNDMMRYAKTHFADEEKLLLQVGYPCLENQKSEHLSFFEQMAEFSMDVIHDRNVNRRLGEFLSGWWLGHILGSDMLYKPYVTSAG